jgi:hypothetical protein
VSLVDTFRPIRGFTRAELRAQVAQARAAATESRNSVARMAAVDPEIRRRIEAMDQAVLRIGVTDGAAQRRATP